VLLLIGAVTGDFVNRKEFLNEKKKKKKYVFKKTKKDLNQINLKIEGMKDMFDVNRYNFPK